MPRQPYQACSRCGNHEETRNPHGTEEHLCILCYRRRFGTCNCCGAEVNLAEDEFHEDGSRFYCSVCYEMQTTPCGECAEPTSLFDLTTTEDDCTYCVSCYDDNFTQCEECETYVRTCDIEDGYCEGCGSRDRWDDRGFFVENPTTTELKSCRKFGIEIETSACPGHVGIRSDTVFGCKPDGSVDGMEFVSPILYGDEGLAEVRKICDHARRLNWEIDSSCGLHLHVDLTEESEENCFKLAYAYMHTYNFWTSFVSDARKRNYYCAKHTYTDADLISHGSFRDWCHFASHGSRYDWCNWYAWLMHKTVELRHHTATLNGNKICNWVKAHTRFIDKVLATPQAILTRELAGRDVYSQSEVIAEWWDDEELTGYYKERAMNFHKEFRPTTLVWA